MDHTNKLILFLGLFLGISSILNILAAYRIHSVDVPEISSQRQEISDLNEALQMRESLISDLVNINGGISSASPVIKNAGFASIMERQDYAIYGKKLKDSISVRYPLTIFKK